MSKIKLENNSDGLFSDNIYKINKDLDAKVDILAESVSFLTQVYMMVNEEP